MKKSLILGTLIACSFGAAQAQVGADTPPPPPPVNVTPPPPVAEPMAPPPPVFETVPAQAPSRAVAPAPVSTVTTVPQETVTVTRTTAQRQDVIDVSPRINRLRFGAYLAPNLSWMRPTAATDDRNQFNVERDGSRAGFTYGLMAEYFFAENYGFITGLQVNQTGGSIITTSVDRSTATAGRVLSADFDYRLQYLEIPVGLKLRTDDINGFRFFGQLGASLGINIGKKVDYTVTYTPDPATNATEEASGEKIKLTGKGLNVIAPVMFQMNIGAGVEYPITEKLRFYTGLFFNNGFAPDATNPEKYDNNRLGYMGSFRDGNVRLNNFALRVGLFF
jgi:hypothetical protein